MRTITAAELLADLGEEDRPGWAFCVGFTVFWSPTRGAAKAAWQRARRDDSIPAGALGERPSRCSLAQAIEWGRGDYPAAC